MRRNSSRTLLTAVSAALAGVLLIAAHGDDPVSFEADHLDETLGYGWSVLVRGQAHRVLQPGELRHLREAASPVQGASAYPRSTGPKGLCGQDVRP